MHFSSPVVISSATASTHSHHAQAPTTRRPCASPAASRQRKPSLPDIPFRASPAAQRTASIQDHMSARHIFGARAAYGTAWRRCRRRSTTRASSPVHAPTYRRALYVHAFPTTSAPEQRRPIFSFMLLRSAVHASSARLYLDVQRLTCHALR